MSEKGMGSSVLRKEDFRLITGSKGLPTKLIYKTGLKVSEILELKKEITL